MSIPAIERHYRTKFIMEELQQLEAELGVLAESTYGAERYRYERAMWHLVQATKLLRDRAPANEQETTELLRQSIALVRDRKTPPESA